MNLPRLIALDLDGTLLPLSKRITERSHRALRAIEALGTRVTLVTGKFLHLADQYAAALRLTTPVVALDGARVGGNGSRLVESCIASATAVELLERYDDLGWDAFADDGADEMLLRSTRLDLRRALSPWADRIRPVDDLRGNLVGAPAILSFYGPPEQTQVRAQEIRREYPGLRVFVFALPHLGLTRLTLQPAGIDKGSGLRQVLRASRITPGECIVFGDWHNDLHMFQLGCINVAMANAVPELKLAAHEVLEHTCEEDGVARFLERHFL